MANFYLIGASGHGKVIANNLMLSGSSVKGFFDDDKSLKAILGYPVLGPIAKSLQYQGSFIISIGNNTIRKNIAAAYNLDYRIAQHPAAIIDDNVEIGRGTVIMAGAVINSSVVLGEHNIINTGSTIDHDCQLSNFVHISPNATLSGNVSVGEGTHIGAGATIIQGIRIGAWCTIGAGAVIIRDVPDGVTVVGNPGRLI